MEFEWDDEKRLKVLEKHALDFRIVTSVFADQHVVMVARSEGETRYIAVGQVYDAMVAVVYTVRGEKIRLITARRARENERRAYRAVHH